MSLTYPSVLGAIIYFFFDASIQVFALPLLDRAAALLDPTLAATTTPRYHFFEAFGLSNSAGFIAFLVITLFIIVHHSTDYLYSKYSEASYDFRNFVWDTIISTLLAIAYIFLSSGASADIQHTKLAFTVFWLSMGITYLVFLWWDLKAYLEMRRSDKKSARFYLGMVRLFEVGGITSFVILAFLALLVTKTGWFSYTFVIISIVTLGVFSVWFCFKICDLEKLTRGSNSDLSSQSKTTQTNGVAIIREMDAADISDCARIFADAYQEVYTEPWTTDSAMARLLELYQKAPDYCLVLQVEESIVGFVFARPFAWYDGTRAWIEEIVIEKQYRGKGFGKQLMYALFERCKDRDVKSLSLISEKNSFAYRMYESMGFQTSDWIHLETQLDKLLGCNRL